MKGSWLLLFLRSRISSPSAPQQRQSLFFEPDCRVRSRCRYSVFEPRPPSPRPTLLLREPTRAEESCNGKTSDICTVGGTALGLVQGARSGPLERLMFCRLQLLAVNYSMSRGGFGGLVASGRVLRNGVPGATAWDGMERGPGARINSGQSLASGSSRLQDSIMSLNHRVASDRIVRRRRAQERSKKKKR